MLLSTLKKDKSLRINITTIFGTIINGIYAIFNFYLGIINHSFWFATIAVYFFVLCIMRTGCVSALYSKNEKKIYVGRLVGLLLILLCIVLAISIVLSNKFDVIKPLPKIVMIAIATFTTFKTTMAIINIIKVKKTKNPVWIAIRNIGCADAAASILTMQRTMLVSFGNMNLSTIKLMNLFTGIGACMVIFILGILLLKRRKI